jgi:hypothetical protein
LETERKDLIVFAPEERARAVELYFTTAMTTAQVVEHPGYPTGQCPGRRLAADSRYAGRMAKSIIALETRRKAIELVLGDMQQKQAAGEPGAGVGAVHNRAGAYREGGMAALQPKNRNAARKPTPVSSADVGADDTGALRRRVAELESENALMREVVEVIKNPGAGLGRLMNREKTRLIYRLRPMFSLSCLARRMGIPPSSYHYLYLVKSVFCFLSGIFFGFM